MLKRVRFFIGLCSLPALATLGLIFIVPAAHAAGAAVDVFGRPVQAAGASAAAGSHAAPSATAAVAAAEVPAAKPAFVLPEPVREVLAAGIVWQGKLNARIEDAAAQLRKDATPRTWLTLLLMSFAYGVLHAIGPGHGKLVISTYLGSRQARVTHAVLLSGWTALVQALSAIVLVVGVASIAKAGVANVLSQAETLEVVSYALLCIAGGWTLWTAVSREDCCFDPTAVELVPKPRLIRRLRAAPMQHESAYLGARLTLRSRGGAGFAAARGGPVFSQIFSTGLAAGVRPCVGAIFVLVAAVAARMPLVGVAASLAMAAGVAITVTLVALGALGANRILLRASRYRSHVQTVQRVFAIGGALLIVLFAAAQVALLLSGYVQPSLA
jgi:nickel/cobalt transporter (NicO) family protein